MTNYANFNALADDYADTRGTMLPSTSLAQYGATLARWFGVTETQPNASSASSRRSRRVTSVS